MSRICRVLFGSTCVGSFVFVVFYVQSLFQPDLQRAPFGEPCCKRGSRSALQELYNPSQWQAAAVLHESRRQHVADSCRQLHSAPARTKRALTPGDLKHLVVDDDHELIYCYVPKVACTNWKRVFMVLGGRGRYRDPMEIPSGDAHVPSNLRTLSQYSAPEINHRLKTFLKFLFVREPFERLVSAYRNKFTLRYNGSFHRRFGTRIVRRYRQNATAEALRRGHDVSFAEFAEFLTDAGARRRDEAPNEHWQTAAELCHPCLIRYDLVGKYETLETDANYVLRLIGNNTLTFPSYAKAARTTDAMTAAFFRNISSERRRRLYQLYEDDFVMFNYSTPSYLSQD